MPTSKPKEQPIFSVEFANTPEDYVQWNKFLIRNNIHNYKVKLILLCFVPTVVAAIITPIISLTDGGEDPFFNIFTGIIISLAIFLLFSLLAPILYFVIREISFFRVRRLVKFFDAVLDNCRMEFFEDYYFTITDTSELKSKYVFTNFYENQDYLFLTIYKTTALILPKKYFNNEQIEFLKSKVTK